MNFLNIGKIGGALISGVIVATYYHYWLPYLHHQWFGFQAEYGWGTKCVLIGLIMTQIVIIQPGNIARLTFLGGELDREWRNGVAFLPNAFHSTIVLFKVALLWGLAVLRNNTYKNYEEPPVNVDAQDVNFNYRVNVTMTPGQARRSQTFDFIWKLFWDYRRVPEEYYVASFGYRVLAIGIIAVCLNSSAIVAKQKLGSAVTAISQSVGAPVQTQRPQTAPAPQAQHTQRQSTFAPQGQMVAPPPAPGFVTFSSDAANRVPFSHNSTYYNLLEYRRPQVIPDPRWFANKVMGGIGRTTDRIFYIQVGQYEQGDLLRSINVRGQANCVIVPKSSFAAIYATSPPKFVINMNDEVLVGVMLGAVGGGISGPDGTFWLRNMSWKMLHDSWEGRVSEMRQQEVSEVDLAHRTAFFVKGPSLDAELHPSLPTGLVCF